MNKIAYQYSIVRFMPFPDAEEFANVGIIVAFPQSNTFHAQLDTTHYKRVTDFFGLKKKRTLYTQTLQVYARELEAVHQMVTIKSFTASQALQGLAKPLQNLIQQSDVRTGLWKEAGATEQDIFDYLYQKYVHADQVKQEYREQVLERHMKEHLKNLNLSSPFKADKLGDKNTFETNFPFVQQHRNKTRVIKPLFLGQPEPSKIIEHGELLISKIRGLERFNAKPDDLLIAFDTGEVNSDHSRNNQQMLLDELKAFGDVIESTNHRAISDFAQQ